MIPMMRGMSDHTGKAVDAPAQADDDLNREIRSLQEELRALKAENASGRTDTYYLRT
jgi:hypothetical protein